MYTGTKGRRFSVKKNEIQQNHADEWETYFVLNPNFIL